MKPLSRSEQTEREPGAVTYGVSADRGRLIKEAEIGLPTLSFTEF